MIMENTVLILGASGKFGGHCGRAFEMAGWNVHNFQRGKQNMIDAAQGADIIVNGLNPPNYQNWATALPAITKQLITAAKSSGATILQPGNVYNFGNTAGVWNESTPQSAQTKKGRVRIDIENMLRDAAQNAGVQTIILRAGDFIDDTDSNNWFDITIAAKLEKGRFNYPGNADISHAWAYLPDLARAAVLLAEKRKKSAMFEDIPFGGYTLTGRQIMGHFSAAIGQNLTLKGFPWSFMRMASPFWPLARELLEMRYLWETEHAMDNARFASLLPDFEPTPVATALRNSIKWKTDQMPSIKAG